eukprot:Sspe_Gene.68724::Locus_40518_Transcript_1_1_Confidence_1.000_Length_1271::g.68724::m.68724
MSDSESLGDFDDDRSVSSYIEDTQHFLRVATALAEEADIIDSPWNANTSSTRLNELGKKLVELAKKHDKTERDLTLEDHDVIEVADEVLPVFHTLLLNWHCKHFFPFQNHFTEAYRKYVSVFLKDSAADHRRNFMLQGERDYYLSAYTFSHRVKGEKVNSARMSYGAASEASPELVQAALEVFKECKVVLPSPFDNVTGDFKFYGLGWDYCGDATYMKIYLHGPYENLPASLKGEMLPMLKEGFEGEVMEHSLVSFTYLVGEDGARKVEDKLYLYPQDSSLVKNVPSGVLNSAIVLSTGEMKRGLFWQYDVTHTAPPKCDTEWRDRFNDAGKRIYDMYYEKHMRLDTLGYENKDSFTIYFPFEP